jgi:hypothetical protein
MEAGPSGAHGRHLSARCVRLGTLLESVLREGGRGGLPGASHRPCNTHAVAADDVEKQNGWGLAPDGMCAHAGWRQSHRMQQQSLGPAGGSAAVWLCADP